MSDAVHSWEPLSIISNRTDVDASKNALVILNQPICSDCKLARLWHQSCLRVCADGGTNRLHEWSSRQQPALAAEYIPDYICGDLDSVDSVIQRSYEAKGAQSIKLHDQDATDFTKTLKYVQELKRSGKAQFEKYSRIANVYCLCEFGGRLDHAISNFSTLYEMSHSDDDLKVYLISSESISFVLKRGINFIFLNEPDESASEPSVLGTHCGFFPMVKPAVVTTHGLKWNVSDAELEFGKFVSSSNEFSFESNAALESLSPSPASMADSRYVMVKSSEPLLWTMSVRRL